MYNVERDVKMPEQRGRSSVYPFGEMEVGDSFAFEAETRHNVQRAASAYGSRNNKKYSVRGLRCWRTE